ncbi:Anaerobic glycerol-3-phosphate dehydrogenase subunit C [Leclercia adecarboxylata]|uniref:Anaerobic glycerol-3-phosphate dehydrogenase subunit C n=1 Tax=Leclercia adecarboxylata TaxID=83655 RepID=A0A4U9I8X0_9ENTR|nr:Anaerobic glycerol-3-phosphate dehydrogenase subunit C [Leclercia adecarboxylata]
MRWALGVQLLTKEKCCGVPLIANGFTDKARKQANSNVTALRESHCRKRDPGARHVVYLHLHAAG